MPICLDNCWNAFCKETNSPQTANISKYRFCLVKRNEGNGGTRNSSKWICLHSAVLLNLYNF